MCCFNKDPELHALLTTAFSPTVQELGTDSLGKALVSRMLQRHVKILAQKEMCRLACPVYVITTGNLATTQSGAAMGHEEVERLLQSQGDLSVGDGPAKVHLECAGGVATAAHLIILFKK